MIRKLAPLACVLLLVSTSLSTRRVAAQAQALYTVNEIGPGYMVSGMNSLGEVVGWAGDNWFVWSRERGFIVNQPRSDAPQYPGVWHFNPSRLAINASGQVSGTARHDSIRGTQPAIWDPINQWQLLGSVRDEAIIGGTMYGEGTTINDSGQVAGHSVLSPVVWTPGIGLRVLTGLERDEAGAGNGIAYDINNVGAITGMCQSGKCGNSGGSAFYWSPETGSTIIYAGNNLNHYAFGHALNDAGVVVGEYRRYNPATQDMDYGVFRWSRAAGLEDLHAPFGFPERIDINNRGDVLLTVGLPGAGYRAYLFRNGTWTPLRDLVSVESNFRPDYAVGITDDGVIGGWGPNLSNLPSGFVLTPGVDTENREAVAVSIDGGPFEYDGVAHAATVTVTSADGTAVGAAITTYNGAAALPVDAGTYSVTAVFDGTPNYLPATATATLTITAAPLQVSAVSVTRELGGPSPAYTAAYAGFVSGQSPSVLAGTLTFDTPATASSPVGVYPLQPGGLSSSNYAITFVPGSVTVVDTNGPTIRRLDVDVPVLRVPNHKMVAVTVSADALDLSGASSCAIARVSSNEPANGLGDGDTSPDWEITGPLTLLLRAERAGQGAGRVYTVTVRCEDASGNGTDGAVTVTVPKGNK